MDSTPFPNGDNFEVVGYISGPLTNADSRILTAIETAVHFTGTIPPPQVLADLTSLTVGECKRALFRFACCGLLRATTRQLVRQTAK